MEINYKLVFAIAAIFLVLGSGIAAAQLGQAAGPLGFGDVPRGGQETLSYGVINAGDAPMTVVLQLSGDIEKIATIEPKIAKIPPGSFVPVYVTVKMPRDAEPGKVYDGNVLVVQSSEGGGSGFGISFNMGLFKSASATAAEEFAPPPKPEPVKEPEQQKNPQPYLTIFILSIVGLAFLYIDPFKWRKKTKGK